MTRGILLKAHALYKAVLSPLLHAPALGLTANCRFQPTCSEYATLAFAQHGPARGLWLSATRLLRCHPFARGGWDPVPTAHQSAFPTLESARAGTIEKAHSTNDPA